MADAPFSMPLRLAKAEYEQMGLWPGEGHFARRYDYSTEYARIMRELWALARPRRRTSAASAAPRPSSLWSIV
jgi:alkanesulfonate monooxygenase SsuD/methylene tetrahydromethanopterin reductase-like flavin-dependent oxidoreductase (luciferase family)